jgi:CRISPR-associated endonuclease/helicase Cas3
MIKPPKQVKQRAMQNLPMDFEYIAKTILSSDGKNQKGVDVITHCKIVGLVARELISRQPDWLRSALFPLGSELVAAAHDIGKISPCFQEKIYRALNKVLGLVNPELDRAIGGHAAVSQAAVSDAGHLIPEILGRHHGVSSLETGLPNDDKYGGKTWQDIRLDYLEKLKHIFRTDWPELISDIHADVLSGLTTVSDWIGSGQSFSPNSNGFSIKDSLLFQLVSESLDLAGFVRPQIRKSLKFEEVFPPYSPYPVQQKVIEAVNGPGVYVLEAPMGLGKTEAALFAAYKAMEKNQATGVYFALPTQLTSDKMVDRMNSFLEIILEEGSSHREALLLHGAAWLRRTDIGEEGRPGRSWFDYRKRGLLAPFAVGTIDQALMAVMNVRHGFVRTFGLAGKVVILDEVHSYDSYTGTIIDHLVKALREIHCTVIILSATLAINRRSSLLGALENSPVFSESAYPLFSAFPRKGELKSYPAATVEEPEIDIFICREDDLAINEALSRAERGEQVLWLENTVEEAQKRFQTIGAKAADLDLDCSLIHSRFLKTDREKNETEWVRIFGKEGIKQRGLKGRILVGTQVLEQSLDIDGDFLVSRICPTDMLLQRIGRLWRHRGADRSRPEKARREAWIMAPELEEAVKDEKKFGKTAWVYAPYVLCRSLEVWENERKIQLTGNKLRALIEATYIDRTEKGSMAQYKHQVEQKRETLSRLARVGLSKGGKTLPESKASTRYTETENVEVLLIRAKRHQDDGVYLRFLDDSILFLPKNIRFRGGKMWRKIAADLQKNTVSVPEWLAPTFISHELKFLKDFVYLGDNEESPFRTALVRESGELVGIGQQEALEGYRLRYDSALGYIATK